MEEASRRRDQGPMGDDSAVAAGDRKKTAAAAAPAPAPPTPTDTDLTNLAPSELAATDVSKSIDDKSSYSLPEDGTPVTIKTRSHRPSHSQTSLLIEYFEGGKPSSSSSKPDHSDSQHHHRKPSVRVRLTPSRKSRKSGSERDHIQITEHKGRKVSSSSSSSRRRTTTPAGADGGHTTPTPTRTSRAAVPAAAITISAAAAAAAAAADTTSSRTVARSPTAPDMEDASSYASATEESNVSRNPIDIEIDRSGNVRRRRPASPLIPSGAPADGSTLSYQPPTASEISAIPTDSFLDGSGPTNSFRLSEAKLTRSRSPARTESTLAGAEKSRGKSRGADGRDRGRERVTISRSRDKENARETSYTRDRDRDRDREKTERKSRSSKSRSSSTAEKERHGERSKTARKRSGGQHEAAASALDSSIVSSPSRRSLDEQSLHSKASSINNPKLLETVEDVIRRLILPELNALKREQSRHKSRRESPASSSTSLSRDDERRRSATTTTADRHSETPREALKKERRDREARHELDSTPAGPGLSRESVDEASAAHQTPGQSTDRLRDAALGAGAGLLAAAAMSGGDKSPSDDKRTRRRRRAELRNRSAEHGLDAYTDRDELVPTPPMPLMSEVNPSDLTRTSILSADTERPRSASEEQATNAAGLSRESDTPTPTMTAPMINLQTSLGTQHANISHGDLKELPRRRTGDVADEERYDEEEEEEEEEGGAYQGNGKMPDYYNHSNGYHYQDEYDGRHGHEAGGYGEPGLYDYDYYNTQDVPPPLKYDPYHPERRGLSPIPSVSGYTEGGSDAANNRRDSRTTHTASRSVSPAEHRDGALRSVGSAPSNVMSRGFDDDDHSSASGSRGSLRSPGTTADYRNTMYTEDSDVGVGVNREGGRGHTVQAVGANPEFISSPVGLESNVASLIDGSMVDSAVTGESGYGGGSAGPFSPRVSMAKGDRYRESVAVGSGQQESASSGSGSGSHGFADEYDVDDYGNKVPVSRANPSRYKQSPTASEAAITVPAAIAAAAALKAAQGRERKDEPVSYGVQRNQSFKERALTGPGPKDSPTHSADRLLDDDDYGQPQMGFHAVPNPDDPLPEMGPWHEEEEEEEEEEPDRSWDGDATPRQQTPLNQGRDDEWQRSSDERKRDTLLTNPYEGASPIANLPGVGDEEVARGFGGAGYTVESPLGLPQHKVDEGYISQGPNKTPEGQAGSANRGVGFGDDPFYTAPPRVAPARQASGLSQGMGSPLYDAATGGGLDAIESKDIMALMQHLMVRDAQRSARDTEILVTLVRSAAETRNSFEDIKKLLADTEDVVVTEVKENTEKTVQRAIGGPRPFPGPAAAGFQASGPRSQTDSRAATLDDLPAKKANLFRRALNGLSAKGTNDLGRIEDMLMQLLSEVDVLKSQTATGQAAGTTSSSIPPDLLPFENDRGYEPDGHAGTSTASQSGGHLSVSRSGVSSGRLGYDRKFSDHRISTVPEANEDDYVQHVRNSNNSSGNNNHSNKNNNNNNNNNSSSSNDNDPTLFMTPALGPQRGHSLPPATPPQQPGAVAPQASLSNDNTPRTDRAKKHKSGSSSSWFPKISRWSETTTSSVAQAFRRSGQSRKHEFPDDDDDAAASQHLRRNTASRSASDIIPYDDAFRQPPPPLTDPYGDDKLHSGFSDAELAVEQQQPLQSYQPPPQHPAAPPPVVALAASNNPLSMTPEDPKYRAHRNSLNLQHPQPRPGQSDFFQAALESQAQDFDSASPRSPHSAEWAGSATSLHRLPRNANRDSYGSASAEQRSQQQQQQQQQRYWSSSPSATAAPPRPPKEPLFESSAADASRETPPKSHRISKLQKQQPVPSYHSVESGYGTMTHGAPSASYVSHARSHSRDDASNASPRPENRNLSGALGVPARRPSGPRAMTPKSMSDDPDAGRRKRDTFGTSVSQETDTF